MSDVNEIIKAINICFGRGECSDCAYHMSGDYTAFDCRKRMLEDILETINELQERISIMQEWNLTSENLPVIPEEATYGIMVLCADDKSQFKKDRGWKNKSYVRNYVRREIRGKTVERWEYVTGQICYDPPKYWMYVPDPPEV